MYTKKNSINTKEGGGGIFIYYPFFVVIFLFYTTISENSNFFIVNDFYLTIFILPVDVTYVFIFPILLRKFFCRHPCVLEGCVPVRQPGIFVPEIVLSTPPLSLRL